MKLILTFLTIFLLMCFVSSVITTPIKAQGTTLPQLTSSSPYRVFNDLMKQAIPFVPYQYIWGGISRYWGYNLTFINGLTHQYPASLATNVYAVSQISFYSGIDDSLLNKSFTLKFSGQGVVGVNQQSLFNTTWTAGVGGTFVLQSLTQLLNVFIYSTNSSNPVTAITILPTSLGANPPTFTSNFLYYLKPFNLLRTCYWQGQNLYNSGISSQIWANRTLTTSASQVSSTGVALEHIL